MLQLLGQGQYLIFGILLLAIICSLTLHEWGHARTAAWLGDETARDAGRLTLNPFAHIDPLGLAMVVMIGFGYARPVPVDIRRLGRAWGPAAVAAAGPLMNLLLAVLAVNIYAWFAITESVELSEGVVLALVILAQINLLLMVFNLLPIGPLDGHYIFSWLLPRDLARRYDALNYRFGTWIFLILIVLSVLGLPIFHFVMNLSQALIPYITFVRYLV